MQQEVLSRGEEREKYDVASDEIETPPQGYNTNKIITAYLRDFYRINPQS